MGAEPNPFPRAFQSQLSIFAGLGLLLLALACGDDSSEADASMTDIDTRREDTSAAGDVGGRDSGENDAPEPEDAGPGEYPFPPIADLRAAPGLQGHGTDTAAGRGGRVLFITNLDDSGPGSARAALEATGPRQIISNVAGEVFLATPITVGSEASFYGQVAPGEGLTFTMDQPESFEGSVIVEGNDVLIQYIRVRGVGEGSYRNLIVLNSRNVVIDHGSFSWSTDQNLNSWFVNENLTFSNCMSYEGLRANAGVAKPTLFGNGGRGISVHHNVMAHGHGRMPYVVDMDDFVIAWNVVHNPGNWAAQIGLQRVGTIAVMHGDVENNWYRRLQNTNPIGGEIEINGGEGRIEAYVAGNYLQNIDGATSASESSDSFDLLDARRGVAIEDDVEVARLPETLLPHAGASLPERDANDSRIVEEIMNGSGTLINDIQGNGGQSQTFIRPEAVMTNPEIDLESVDGVPDEWKETNGLAPGTDLTQQDSNGDGYTDWEDWRRSVFGA